MTATDMHTTQELLEAVFAVRSVPRLYNDGQLPLDKSVEMAMRRVGCWCEMAVSLRASQLELVVTHFPTGKNMNTETEAAMEMEAVTPSIVTHIRDNIKNQSSSTFRHRLSSLFLLSHLFLSFLTVFSPQCISATCIFHYLHMLNYLATFNCVHF
jgi:hypothetical protein